MRKITPVWRLRSSGEKALAALAGASCSPSGIPLNLDWIENIRVNTSAVERRAQSCYPAREKRLQVAWLLRAITCMDLTTLSGDDTDERVRRLCAKGRLPIRQDLVKLLGIESLQYSVAAFACITRFGDSGSRLEEAASRLPGVDGFPRDCRRSMSA